MDSIVNLLLQGLVIGAEWGVIAACFGLIARVTGVFHIAVAGIFAVGAYTVILLVEGGYPLALAMGVGVLAAVIVSVLVDVLVYIPLSRAKTRSETSQITSFVASLGAMIVITNMIQYFAAARPRGGRQPDWGVLTIGGANVTVWTTAATLFSLILVGLLALWLSRTRVGRGAVALGQNVDGARVVGVDPTRVHVALFAVTGAAAGCAGAMAGVSRSMTPTGGLDTVLSAALIVLIAPQASVIVWWLMAVGAGWIYAAAAIYGNSGWAQITQQVALIMALVTVRILIPRFRTVRDRRKYQLTGNDGIEVGQRENSVEMSAERG